MNNQNENHISFSDNFIADAIINSEYLLDKYKHIIDKIVEQQHIIEPPISDLNPYYIIKSRNDKSLVLKGSYIGKIVPIVEKNDDVSNIYIKWAWSDTTLGKASKVNLIKILKYFLDREPGENSPIFTRIYTAFIQSTIKVDERFFQVLLNALLHLMKHLFYVLIKKDDIIEIYLIKELIN
jgi:hypothetical protein